MQTHRRAFSLVQPLSALVINVMLSFIALCAVSPFDQLISCEFQGSPITDVAKGLSEKVGMPIRVSNTIGRENLVIHITDRKLESSLDLICEAMGASWVQDKDGITLHRTSEQTKAEEIKEKSRRIDALRKWQSAPLPPAWTEEKARQLVLQAEAIAQKANPRMREDALFKQMNALAKLTPDFRASLAARKKIDVNSLAQVGRGKRMVLSTKPNALQAEIKNGNSVIDTFTKEQSLFMPLAQASMERVPQTEIYRDIRQWAAQRDLVADRLIVSAYSIPYVPGISIRIYLTSKNTILCMTGETINLIPDERQPLPKVRFENLPEVIDLSGAILSRHSASINKHLSNRPDPSAWLLGPTICAYSRELKRDVVASIPDIAIDRGVYREVEKDGYAFLNGSLDMFCGWEEKHGAIVIRPWNPVTARRENMDRGRLTDFSEKLKKTKHLSFELAAEFLGGEAVEIAGERILGTCIVAATDGEPFRGLVDIWEGPTLRFWGRMGQSERTGNTTFSRLNAGAKLALNEWIFGTTSALQTSTLTGNDPDRGLDLRRLEPTEQFPNGIPDEMSIDCSITNRSVLWQSYDNSTPYWNRMEESGSVVQALDNPAMKFAPGQTRTLKMNFSLTPISLNFEFDEPAPVNGLTWVDGKGLDRKLVDQLKSIFEQEQKLYPTKRSVPPPR